jgi:hypothetical protein
MSKAIHSGFIIILLSFFYTPSVLHAEIIVHDRIAIAGKPVMLEAETREGFFKKGGELVEFFLDGESIGKNLSGGDGLAYKEITPGNVGHIRISVASGKERGEGLLLVLRKGRGLIFIDVEGTMKDGQLGLKPIEGSKEAVEKIAKRFPVIYLQTGMFGGSMAREWLKENGFMEAPLVPWDNGSVFEEITGMGLKIKAVIGTSDVISSAEEFKPSTFTFEEDVDGAETVEDWDEVADKLK